MLSYLHGFHAGNFADVHKHLIYCLVLDYLLKKDKPLAVIDVYAGAGFYDLQDARAKKLPRPKPASWRCRTLAGRMRPRHTGKWYAVPPRTIGRRASIPARRRSPPT